MPRGALSNHPARALVGVATWPPRLHPSIQLRSCDHESPHETRSSCTQPVAGGQRFLRPCQRPVDFCNRRTTHGHTRRASDPRARVGRASPLLTGTLRCRLRWPFDALPHRGSASCGPPSKLALRRPTCAGERSPLAEYAPETSMHGSRTTRADSSRTRFRHPSHRRRFAAGPGGLTTRFEPIVTRPSPLFPGAMQDLSRSIFGGASRKATQSGGSRCLPSRQSPYATAGFPDVRAWTGALSRRLGRGLAREHTRLCDRQRCAFL